MQVHRLAGWQPSAAVICLPQDQSRFQFKECQQCRSELLFPRSGGTGRGATIESMIRELCGAAVSAGQAVLGSTLDHGGAASVSGPLEAKCPLEGR